MLMNLLFTLRGFTQHKTYLPEGIMVIPRLKHQSKNDTIIQREVSTTVNNLKCGLVTFNRDLSPSFGIRTGNFQLQ